MDGQKLPRVRGLGQLHPRADTARRVALLDVLLNDLHRRGDFASARQVQAIRDRVQRRWPPGRFAAPRRPPSRTARTLETPA